MSPHFSDIIGVEGYRALSEGEIVEFTWEHYPFGQHGYLYRAIEVSTKAPQSSENNSA